MILPGLCSPGFLYILPLLFTLRSRRNSDQRRRKEHKAVLSQSLKLLAGRFFTALCSAQNDQRQLKSFIFLLDLLIGENKILSKTIQTYGDSKRVRLCKENIKQQPLAQKYLYMKICLFFVVFFR